MHMARIRSPNYPQIGLPAAIERVRLIYKVERQNRMERDVAVKVMGFGGYNGASAAILSAILKYGLLERPADGVLRVSDLAVRILVPHEEAEKLEALNEAAFNPPLFKELSERWPDARPSDHSLRSYLTRRGFADNALEGVMNAYEETLSLVDHHGAHNDEVNFKSEAQSELSPPVEPHEKLATSTMAKVEPAVLYAEAGPSMNLVRTKGGYVVQLGGAVLSKEHVDEVVTLLTALKSSMPDKAHSEDRVEDT